MSGTGRVGSWLARQTARPGVRAPFVPLIALVAAGVVLVVHGEPSPVQQYSGVSVPVATDSSGPVAVVLPSLLTLSDGALLRVAGDQRIPVDLPSDATPLAVQQVSQAASAALVQRPDGRHAILLPSGGGALDLGLADRLTPGAHPAVVAIERLGEVRRYDATGSRVGDPVALPAGMALGADSTLGIVASTAVGPIAPVEDGVPPLAQEVLAGTRTALQRGALWISVGPYQPLAASGTVVLVWDPLTRGLGLLDLRRLTIMAPLAADQLPGAPVAPVGEPTGSTAPSATASPLATLTASPTSSPPLPAAPFDVLPLSLTPVPYPSLLGLDVTGPAAFAYDGRWIAIAARVGDRPRLVVGPAPTSIVHGVTQLSSLSVISLGGLLSAAHVQPVPVWTSTDVIAARLDGSVVVYSTLTRKAVGQPLPPSRRPVPAPTSSGSTAPPQRTGELPVEAGPTGLPSDTGTGTGGPSGGSGPVVLPVINGLGIG